MRCRPIVCVYTESGTVASSSTAIVCPTTSTASRGRHYLLIQNTGTNPINVAIGSHNSATSKHV
jgi:hypothetical protein